MFDRVFILIITIGLAWCWDSALLWFLSGANTMTILVDIVEDINK